MVLDGGRSRTFDSRTLVTTSDEGPTKKDPGWYLSILFRGSISDLALDSLLVHVRWRQPPLLLRERASRIVLNKLRRAAHRSAIVESDAATHELEEAAATMSIQLDEARDCGTMIMLQL